MAVFKRVLIIDDDDLFLHLSEFILEDENFANEIIKFDYAQRALDYLNSIANDELPEVIFLDINMPLMDGWEFMDAMTSSKTHLSKSIYIMSSSIDPKDLEKAEKNPLIKGFISKPLDAEKLKKIENEFVN